jgi:nitrogen fixation protein FixH
MFPNSSTAAPASYNPWPHALMAFFALLFAAMAGVVWIVVHQPSELVSRNYYDQEMLYQGRMEAIRRTQALGRQMSLKSEPGRLIVNLPSDQARRGPVGIVHLFRPADARLDREFKLAIDPSGRQSIDLRDLEAGLWRVRMEWVVGAETFYREEALVL